MRTGPHISGGGGSAWLLVPAAAVTVAAAAAITMLPAMAAYGVVVGVAALFFAFVVPVPILTGAWAALLPIWSIGPINPLYFDVARLGGAIIIGLRSPAAATGTEWHQAVRSWTAPLTLAAGSSLLIAGVRSQPEMVASARTMLIAIAAALFVLWRLPSPWPVLRGIAVGVTASAAVMLASAVGVGISLVHNTDAGFSRLTGLSSSAPRASLECALGVVICWVLITKSRKGGRFLAIVGAVMCFAGLALSGGRLGAAGIALAAVVATMRGWIRPFAMLLTVSFVAVVVAEAPKLGIKLNTLDRLQSAADTSAGFSTGRTGLAIDALRSIQHHPIFGEGLESFRLWNGGVYPHMPVLLFWVGSGAVAGLTLLYLTIRLGWSTVRPLRGGKATPEVRAAVLIAAVLFADSFLEPAGPFIGAETLTLLLLTMATLQVQHAREKQVETTSGERRPLVGV